MLLPPSSESPAAGQRRHPGRGFRQRKRPYAALSQTLPLRRLLVLLLLLFSVAVRNVGARSTGYGIGVNLVETPFGVSHSSRRLQRRQAACRNRNRGTEETGTLLQHASVGRRQVRQSRRADTVESSTPRNRRSPVLQCSRAAHRTRTTDDAAKAVVQASAIAMAVRPLLFWENMVCGAISRSVAQTVMHPANTMKTILQSSRGIDAPTINSLLSPKMFRTLTRGAGANFLLSVPHGAVNFAVLEFVRGKLNKAVEQVPVLARRSDTIGPGLDFMSSAISTICCSVVSTPQMMITDNIMAGNYPNLASAVAGLYNQRGVMGFYSGWWPGLVGKIPSYALTWTFFQQLKDLRNKFSDRPARNYENTIMGCIASGTTVCIMIPLDTIKTRLVTQGSAALTSSTTPYKGIVDCAVRIAREEGVRTFYRGLAPRLISVVPMIGIQFGVYEAMKKVMVQRQLKNEEAEKVDARVIADEIDRSRRGKASVSGASSSE